MQCLHHRGADQPGKRQSGAAVEIREVNQKASKLLFQDTCLLGMYIKCEVAWTNAVVVYAGKLRPGIQEREFENGEKGV